MRSSHSQKNPTTYRREKFTLLNDDVMNHIIAILLDDELAGSIGKKGSENSIVYYNGTYFGERITILTPVSIEDKIYAAAQSMLISEQILIGTHKIDRLFGEIIAASALLDKKTLITKDNDTETVLRGIKFSQLSFCDRSDVINEIIKYKSVPQTDDPKVNIDKSFIVKGIGTVLLGIVVRGKVSVHDKLYLSSGKEVTIRSIQSNDISIESADSGTRVGLAIKGAISTEVWKGDILTRTRIKPSSDIHAKIRLTEFAKEEIKNGSNYSIVSNFSHTMVNVVSFDGTIIHLKSERPIPLENDDEILLLRGKTPRIFAYGIIEGIPSYE